MEGAQVHKKDCFEFLLHDMKHMENFAFVETYFEQVSCSLLCCLYAVTKFKCY